MSMECGNGVTDSLTAKRTRKLFYDERRAFCFFSPLLSQHQNERFQHDTFDYNQYHSSAIVRPLIMGQGIYLSSFLK